MIAKMCVKSTGNLNATNWSIDKRGNWILCQQHISNGEHRDWIIQSRRQVGHFVKSGQEKAHFSNLNKLWNCEKVSILLSQ